jgi:putative endonuclease
MYYVYVLLCKDNSLYTGSSDNPETRFLDHLNGKGAKYTKSHKPLKIIFTQSFPNKSLALKREWEIKSWTRSKKLRELNLDL